MNLNPFSLLGKVLDGPDDRIALVITKVVTHLQSDAWQRGYEAGRKAHVGYPGDLAAKEQHVAYHVEDLGEAVAKERRRRRGGEAL